jgi:hypothetical protein
MNTPVFAVFLSQMSLFYFSGFTYFKTRAHMVAQWPRAGHDNEGVSLNARNFLL